MMRQIFISFTSFPSIRTFT